MPLEEKHQKLAVSYIIKEQGVLVPYYHWVLFLLRKLKRHVAMYAYTSKKPKIYIHKRRCLLFFFIEKDEHPYVISTWGSTDATAMQ